MKFTECTTKDCPPGINPPEKKSGRAFQFYLRPKFYSYLRAEDHKPANWEELMLNDKILFANQKEQKTLERKNKDKQMKDMMSGTVVTKSHLSEEGNINEGSVLGGEEEDDTEDEMTDPPTKKSKVE